jgi:TolB-like protein/pimeloyl-ACP methyl ester carboxylesterase/Tfp pilus assembly protein PilF/predicted Ser/Thr protein kinase
MEQQIRYCTTSDGVRIAYTIMGEGPPVIRVQGWFSHLEYEWKSQYWRPLVEVPASQHLQIRYDGRGVGLSDRQVSDFSLEAHVRDLEAVIDAAGIERFGLIGISQGGPRAITYAARHPERVTHLVLYGSYARPRPGGLNLETAEGQAQVEAMLTLMRHGWGSDSPAFRQMFTGLFMPDADSDSIREFNEMQRASTSGETAAALFAAMTEVDVTDLLPKVSAPTLVIHRKGDAIVPFERGRELATAIPGACFLPVEGNNHAILPHEPELLIIGAEIDNFTREVLKVEEERRQSAGIGLQTQSPSEKDLVGKVISHYRILEKLGEGGMGVVYKAEDTKLERTIALKFLSPQALGTEEEKIRFVREAKAAAALDHSSICHTYEIDEVEGQAFIAMAYVDGESLDKRIASGPLDHNDAMDIAIQLAGGLRHAHRRGIVHRDIKPQNIILTEEGQAKILDFGLAKLTGKTRLTKTATIMGTVSYMSPEQAHGEAAIDHRTDIWSLGVVMYEMLAGKQPFDAPSDAGLIHKIIYEEPEPLSSVHGGVPVALERAVKKTLQKNPEERYEDMEALISDLKLIRSGAAPVIVVEEKATPSIAVLPFADMSPQKDQEYFCDGISESIINELTQLSDLRVIARTSAFSFKGQNLDVREIGKKLNVGTVLEGSIQKAGDRVRVTAQLVNTNRGEHLWSEKYDRDMEDIFAIQDEISEAIVDKLKPALLGEDKAKIAKLQAIDIEAYNLYLKGRYFLNKLSAEGLQSAIECFKEVTGKAPDFAPAYAGLADAYIVLPFYGSFRPKQVFPLAKEAALKALTINEALAETHVALANIKTFYEFDWENSEKEFGRAIELNPGYAYAHFMFSTTLGIQKRFKEAFEEIYAALELDPLSLSATLALAELLIFDRRYDESIETSKKIIQMDPNWPISHIYLGQGYFFNGLYAEAIEEFNKEKAIGSANTIADVLIGSTYAKIGKEAETRKILNNLAEKSLEEYVAPSFFAGLHFALADFDEGFRWLERAYKERDPLLLYIKANPFNDIIRSDTRYHAILKKVGLAKPDATVPIIEPSPSIAVLPFVNMSADPEQEYFCDGLAEELINALTQIKDLHVVARTSAFSFKGQNLDVREIGKKLNVETVLEGSVRKAGNRLRITGQLVKVADGYHLWSDKYDREMEDIFAIQDEITLAIVDNLKPKLLGEEEARLAKRPTVDLEAYNLYLRGRHLWNKRTVEAIEKSHEYFKQAIAKDPNYAAAYAGLADYYLLLLAYSSRAPKQIIPKARDMALKALEIDDSLAEAHTSLAMIMHTYDWDWEAAEREFKYAVELNPGYTTARIWYSFLLSVRGRLDEARQETEKALELDPFSSAANRDHAMGLLNLGEYDRAIEILRKSVELDPHIGWLRISLGQAYWFKGMYEEALEEYKRASDISDYRDTQAEAFIGATYAFMGRQDEARKRLDQLLKRRETQYVSACQIAGVCFILGDIDQGFRWLEMACEERDYFLVQIVSSRYVHLLNLGADPRYAAILKKMNLDK